MSRVTRLRLARYLLIALLCCQVSGVFVGIVQADSARTRVELLATFLYRVGSYVEWPTGSLPESQTNLGLCVVGDPELGGRLLELEGKPLKQRVFHVRSLNSKDSFAGCHILFVGESGIEGALLLERAKHQTGLLTISDHIRFACEGGILQFYDEDDTLKLIVNTDAARRAKLEFSANVLALAKIESDDGCRGEAP